MVVTVLVIMLVVGVGTWVQVTATVLVMMVPFELIDDYQERLNPNYEGYYKLQERLHDIRARLLNAILEGRPVRLTHAGLAAGCSYRVIILAIILSAKTKIDDVGIHLVGRPEAFLAGSLS